MFLLAAHAVVDAHRDPYRSRRLALLFVRTGRTGDRDRRLRSGESTDPLDHRSDGFPADHRPRRYAQEILFHGVR